MLFVLTCSFVSMAEQKNGSIHILVENDGLAVSFCQVLKLEDGNYSLMPAFEKSGVTVEGILSYPTLENAKQLLTYVQKENISSTEIVSENGEAVLESAELGIWLVYGKENQEQTFSPFFVFVPQVVNGESIYDITATPKMDEIQPDEISISVTKKWDDDQNRAGKRPESIQVNLLQNGQVVESVKLQAENAWSHTFQGLAKSAEYSVNEEEVEGYRASYNGDVENGFVITNTYEEDEQKPITGDNQKVGLMILLCGVSAIVLIWTGVKRGA